MGEQRFDYTGASQPFVAPAGVSEIEVEVAAGGAVDRLVASYDSPSSAALQSDKRLLVSGYPSGGQFTWPWGGDVDKLNDDDPDKPSQVGRVETMSRLWKFEVEIDPGDLPDAWGTTTIRLLKNGTVLNVLYNLDLTTTVARVETQIWAYEVVSPGDRLQVQASAQGGHVDGRVTLHYCDAI